MKKYLLPSTKYGKISFILFGLFIILFVLVNIIMIIIGPRDTQNETIFSYPLISIPMILAGLSIISSSIIGIISIIRQKERCIFVFISSLIGIFVLWFIIGEIVVRH